MIMAWLALVVLGASGFGFSSRTGEEGQRIRQNLPPRGKKLRGQPQQHCEST
jgi:hypothetical protein